MAGFNLLELVKVPLRCKSEVFIVSVKGDPRDMREFDFDDPNAKSVAIQQVVDIPAQTATQRAKAFEEDRKTPFKFRPPGHAGDDASARQEAQRQQE
jgi:hypothetical protein